ncbi:MAG: FG-GAP-like repeat-containing protein [Planctomycetes bacterium]|nr:FG-GAP-like repeat-containing protein [Planctomycetota bacterium]
MLRSLSLSALIFLCFGCKPPESKVLAIAPAGNNVPLSQMQIDVEFDRPMRTATITPSTFYATGSISGKHTGSIVFPAPHKARLTVLEPFAEGELVTVVLHEDIRSTSGKYLEPHVHTFTMHADPVILPDPFFIESVSPLAESAGVSRFATVNCTFSDTYNPFTITEETVRLEGERSGIHPVTFENRFTGITQLRLRSDRPFLAGERVSVSFADSITSADGAHLAESIIGFFAANDGSTWPTAEIAAGNLAGPAALYFLDADGDGRDEWLIVEESGAARIGELEGDVVAEFTGTLPGTVISHAIGDFNGDGRADLACLSADGTHIYLVLGTADLLSFFGGVTTIDFAVIEGGALSAGHVDGDGVRDLVVTAAAPVDGALVLWGSPAAPLATSLGLSELHAAAPVAIGDFDGDFAADIAYPRTDGMISVEWGLGGGNFGATTIVDVPGGVAHVANVNLSAASPGDLLAVPGSGTDATLLIAEGGRGFELLALDPGEASAASAVIDWDGDGSLDLLTPDATAAEVRVLLGTGSGALNESSTESVLAVATGLRSGDIDGDGVVDLGFVFGSASWSVRFGVPATPPIGDTLRITDLSAAPGAAGVEFFVEGDHENDLSGYTLAFAFDPALLTVNELATAGTDAGNVGVEFEFPEIDAAAGEVILGAIFDLVPPYDGQALAAGSDHTFARGTLDVSASAPNTITVLALANGIGAPPTDNSFVIGGFSLAPDLESGTVTISGTPAANGDFVRGDANGDGALDLADAITLESFLLEGGSEPPCLDAADANDDGVVNLADSTYLLAYLFSLGPVPPPPFPAAGPDPTSDSFACPGPE